MSYDLKAIIAGNAVADEILPGLGPTVVVRLEQGLSIIPTSDEWLGAAGMGKSARPFSEFENLTIEVAEIMREASARAAIAYVEGESFGNVSGQSAAVWRDGKLALPPKQVIPAVWTPEGGPINEALRLLGVVRVARVDEFESVGLTRFRHTEQWRIVPGLIDRLPEMDLTWQQPRRDDSNYYATTASGQNFSLMRGRGPDTPAFTLSLIGAAVGRSLDALPSNWRLAIGPSLESSTVQSQPPVRAEPPGRFLQRLVKRWRGKR